MPRGISLTTKAAFERWRFAGESDRHLHRADDRFRLQPLPVDLLPVIVHAGHHALERLVRAARESIVGGL